MPRYPRLVPNAPRSRIHVVNATFAKQFREPAFVFTFGLPLPKHVLVFERSIERALEDAAAYCAEQGWDDIVQPFETFEPCCEECTAQDAGTCDCVTYTESGFLENIEWTAALEFPFEQREELKNALIRLAGGVPRSDREGVRHA